jgi:hypothetical protein
MKYSKGAKKEPDKTIFAKGVQAKKTFSGYSPNVFVGSFGYPFISLGALSSEDKRAIDTPSEFRNSKVEEVVAHRQQFVNSKLSMHVKNATGRFVEQLQDIAKSSLALDSEVDLVKAPSNSIQFHQKSMPHGPSATLKKLELTTNAKVKRKVESITSDTDVKATDAIRELGNAAIEEHQLTKLLSAGTLGQKRKLVPTKWSITAVDDMRSKQLLEELESAEDIHPHHVQATFMGNTFFLIFLPGAWSFELLEITFPNTIYNSSSEFLLSHDYEYPQGRKSYVQETAGAYYATRLAVLEYLKKYHKQGKVICLRTITPAYTAPLGVWVVREGVRMALQAEGKEVSKVKASISSFLTKQDTRIDAKIILAHLQLLKETQLRLQEF